MKGMISFDLDGVLANFTRGFTRIANRIYGTPVGSEQSQQKWMFEDFPELGLTKEMCDFNNGPIWAEVKRNPRFWADLDPMNVSVMRDINRIKNKIFITNRLGVDPKGQSIAFLEKWGVSNPHVIVASKKAPVALDYNVVAHVDDYIVNCNEMFSYGPKDCYLALHWAPYNMEHHAQWKSVGGEITVSVEQFIQECEKRGLVEYYDNAPSTYTIGTGTVRTAAWYGE